MKDPSRTDYLDNAYIDSNSADVLNCRRLPARLTMPQVAVLLCFQIYELQLLIRRGVLKCLGSPSQNSRKYFSASYVQKLANNDAWLHRASKIVSQTIRDKNRKQTSCTGELAA